MITVALSMLAVTPQANGTVLSACWVELRLSPPFLALGRSGLEFPLLANFTRYSAITKPSVPDYRIGMTADKYLVVLFRESCEASREAIAALVGDSMAKDKVPRTAALIVRPPRPSDVRLAKFIMGKPKFRRRDCTVGIDIVRPPRKDVPLDRDFIGYLIEYNKSVGLQLPFSVAEFVDGRDRSRYYLVYWRSCDRRIEMAKRFLAAFRRYSYDGGRYEVLDQKFDAGISKGKISGNFWLDDLIPDEPPQN